MRRSLRIAMAFGLGLGLGYLYKKGGKPESLLVSFDAAERLAAARGGNTAGWNVTERQGARSFASGRDCFRTISGEIGAKKPTGTCVLDDGSVILIARNDACCLRERLDITVTFGANNLH